jgi:hypothetical protein
VSGGIATGGVAARSLQTGPSGPIFSVNLGIPRGSTLAAASGTVVWSFAPHRNITVREVSISFPVTGPQGGRFAIKLHTQSAQGTLTSKATAGASVGTGAKSFVRFTNLAVTCNAGRALAIAVLTVGSTAAGRGGRPVVHYTYR